MSRTPPQTRIFITGFMGAGKTTVARELARALACEALDLDEFIEAREGRSPRALIDEEGEAAFRDIETRALRAVLETERARVVALGGGTWAFGRNRALIEAGPHRFTVWLDAPFGLCWERIRIPPGEGGDDRGRPLARERESALALYDERRALYGLADARVEVAAEDDARALAERVLKSARDWGERLGEKS